MLRARIATPDSWNRAAMVSVVVSRDARGPDRVVRGLAREMGADGLDDPFLSCRVGVAVREWSRASTPLLLDVRASRIEACVRLTRRLTTLIGDSTVPLLQHCAYRAPDDCVDVQLGAPASFALVRDWSHPLAPSLLFAETDGPLSPRRRSLQTTPRAGEVVLDNVLYGSLAAGELGTVLVGSASCIDVLRRLDTECLNGADPACRVSRPRFGGVFAIVSCDAGAGEVTCDRSAA
jgi:hypothetical protein